MPLVQKLQIDLLRWLSETRRMSLQVYLNYVQTVLGAKNLLLPQEEVEIAERNYNFVSGTLGAEAKEILVNIAKALKAVKFSTTELKIDLSKFEASHQSPAPEMRAQNKDVMIIFGQDAAQFLIPKYELAIGQTAVIEGTETLVTHSVEQMRLQPELKRDAWKHLQKFVNT